MTERIFSGHWLKRSKHVWAAASRARFVSKSSQWVTSRRKWRHNISIGLSQGQKARQVEQDEAPGCPSNHRFDFVIRIELWRCPKRRRSSQWDACPRALAIIRRSRVDVCGVGRG